MVSTGGQVLLFAFTLTSAIYANALDCVQTRSFINEQRSVAESHPEDRRYLCRFILTMKS
jgi:hypothetical protein